jgi:hypothetical protein
MNLNHRVVAMVGGDVKRVLCLTCNKQHNYRAPRSTTLVASPGKSSSGGQSRQPRTTAGQRDWQALVGDKESADFSPYSMSSTYTAGQLVSHPKFGRGYVREALDGTKVAIIFREGARTLIHGRSA